MDKLLSVTLLGLALGLEPTPSVAQAPLPWAPITEQPIGENIQPRPVVPLTEFRSVTAPRSTYSRAQARHRLRTEPLTR